MDLWLIAATAATSYIAKHLPNVRKSKDHTLESSSSEDIQHLEPESPRCLLRPKKPKENKFGDEKMKSDVEIEGIHSSVENSGNFGGIHSDSLFSTLAGNNSQLSSCKSSVRNITFIRRNRNRNQRCRLLTKPLSSLKTFEFHREQMTMEDYMIPSAYASISRPLLVTDGARVINKNTADSLWLSQHFPNKAAQVYEIPPLDPPLVDFTKSKVLYIGILIGILSSFMATQTEVNKVKESLKQRENLVYDLQDEQDSLENVESQCKEKVAEDLESVSNIEAELEAELERLEVNMNSSNIELEPNFEVKSGECNQDRSGNLTPELGNCGVSARELSLRLHEVINSQLVERITELETALQESQRKMEQLVMESESKKHEIMRYERDIKHTETQQPLVMNLKGEALDAFNESYDELMNISDDSEEDETPLEIQETEHQEKLYSTNKSSPWSHVKDSSMASEDLNIFRDQEMLDEEENSDFEREMEKLLIKQIVEKTKQGSSVVLNAQKMLLFMEEKEQNPWKPV